MAFDTASLFGRGPTTSGPASGVQATPGPGGFGQVDQAAAMEALRRMYPQAAEADLQSMAQGQMAEYGRLAGGAGGGQSFGSGGNISQKRKGPMFGQNPSLLNPNL